VEQPNMSKMLDEIHEQPDVIRRLVANEKKNAVQIAEELARRNIGFASIAARGTSDNAATYGKYLFGIVTGMPVALAAPSVFTLYKAKPKFDGAFVVGISQSGQAQDVIEYLQGCREAGAATACITNEPGSDITKVAEFTILCHAGAEKSVAATKTYTATLAALTLLCATISGRRDLIDGLLAAADGIEEIFACCEEHIAERSERYRYMQDCIVLARGINRATAFETGLKLAETCYVSADAFSAADFLHGPIAVVNEELPSFLFAPAGPGLDSMIDMSKRLKAKGAEMITISNDKEALSYARTPFRIPVHVEEILSPIVYIVPGQLFAQSLAVTKGLDPDKPRGLKKVTITR
jgi:glutamine---fructose-6-phosphate transaminase (isomerizing)